MIACCLMTAQCGAPIEESVDVGGLRVGDVLGGESDGYATAAGVVPFVFPRDHAAHPAYRSEWWYLTMVLERSSEHEAREFGAHFTLFRQALTPTPSGASNWQSGQAYLAHLAVTDVAAGQHVYAQRFSRAHPANAFVRLEAGLEATIEATIEDWTLRGGFSEDGMTLSLSGRDGARLGVDLSMRQTRPIRLQGDQGWSRKGADQASYYYSIPRLAVAGTILVDGQSYPVQGHAWLDREWSTSVLGDDLEGWDWFALRLDRGSDIMAFRLRRRDGARDAFDHGLYVDEQGATSRTLGPDDFLLTPLRWWRDGQNVRWPVSWRLDLGSESYLIDAMVDDQVMRLGLTYYEGLVAVRDQDGRDIGRGYMELTGYRNEERQ